MMQSLVDLERTSSLLYLRLVLSFIIFYVLSLHICAWSSHLICLETGNRSHKIKTGAPPLDPLLAELVQVETYEQLQAQVPHLSVFFSNSLRVTAWKARQCMGVVHQFVLTSFLFLFFSFVVENAL
jgi:hypothetical protein